MCAVCWSSIDTVFGSVWSLVSKLPVRNPSLNFKGVTVLLYVTFCVELVSAQCFCSLVIDYAYNPSLKSQQFFLYVTYVTVCVCVYKSSELVSAQCLAL